MTALFKIGLNIVVFFLILSSINATVVITPISNASRSLSRGIEDYASTHSGKLPTDWSQLDPYLIRSVEGIVKGPIAEHFRLLPSSNVSMPPRSEEKYKNGIIIAISLDRIKDDREKNLGRYVIGKYPNGKIYSYWMEEQTAQALFEKANTPLAPGSINVQPPALPAYAEYVLGQYAKQHFKNPNNPTAKELEKMKEYMAKHHSDKNPAPTPDNSTPIPDRKTPDLAMQSASKPVPAITPTTKLQSQTSSSVPIVVGILLLLAVAGFVFYRRKS